jgi:hypothetical protein
MNSKTKFAALAITEAVFLSSLVACGGGSDATPAAAQEQQVSSPDSQIERVRPGTATSVTVTPTAGGTVTSTPAGISCSTTNLAGCTASFTSGTLLTLSAAASTGYTFTGWGGGVCTGTADCSGKVTKTAYSATATFTSTGGGGGGSAGAPVVSYTDSVSGPVTGGENNLGGYLSVYGSNFGSASDLGTNTKVYIGGIEVANYRYLGAAKVGAKLGLQQITVQVGNLTGLPLGTAEPIKVVVNGVASNVNNTFTPNPGRVLFASLTGNDDTAIANDISHPWRHLQTPTFGGVHAVLHAGDQVVIRGGNWSDIGFDNSWFRFRYTQQQGTKPTGAANTGWIQFTAYPGPIKGNAIEDVHYSTPANMKGGFQGANSAYYATTGDYVGISNLRLDVNANATSDAAPINLQYSAGPWRVVNNELGPWPAAIHSLAAGVSGHGNGTVVMGNHIHNIACTGASENHGIYADSGSSNWNIGYNWIHDITGGNLIQLYDNVGLAGNSYVGFPANWTGFTGMNIHHNWMENSGKYGLNMADGIQSGSITNNVIKGSLYSGLRINTISKNMDLTVAFNTFYDNDRLSSGSGNAQVLNTWGNYSPTGSIRIYDNIFAAGPSTISSSRYYENAGNADGYLDFRRNLYFDNGYGWANNSRDSLALQGDPKFTSASTGDFSLTSASPAINTGTQATPVAVTDDFTRKVSRPSGGANDVGAFERPM